MALLMYFSRIFLSAVLRSVENIMNLRMLKVYRDVVGYTHAEHMTYKSLLF